MSRALNPWDSQTERIFTSDGAWHTLHANTGGGQARDCVLIRLADRRAAAESADGRELVPGPERGGSSYLFEPRSLKEENWWQTTVKNALRAEASKSAHVLIVKNT